MRIKKRIMAIAACAFSLNAMAGTMGSTLSDQNRPWSVIGSLGYTWYNDLYNGGPGAQQAIGDGQTALGRFAIARKFGGFKTTGIGLEIGVQSGNTARLSIPQATLDEIGGISPQITIKPILDLLATVSWQPVESIPVFGLVKPGIVN